MRFVTSEHQYGPGFLLARAEETDYQILLTRYALERLLYRLSVSSHRDRFILKGALLFVTWLDDPFRPTRDLDLLGYGANDAEAMTDTFKAICSTPVPDDGIIFDVDGLTAVPIREDLEYGGMRVQTYALIDGACIPIQVDIGLATLLRWGRSRSTIRSSSIFPRHIFAPIRSRPLSQKKFNAIVILGIANSRLKDFYDLWLISRTFEFDGRTLSTAVQRTFERRETPMPTDVPTGLTRLFAEQSNAQ